MAAFGYRKHICVITKMSVTRSIGRTTSFTRRDA